MTREKFIRLVHKTERPKIRAGEEHRFIDIWIVVTEGRMFCRQYYFSKKSWYSAFIKNSTGYIQIGDDQLKVHGVVPADLDEINPKINASYIAKYTEGPWPNIAREMTGEKFMARTLELIPV